MGEIADMMIDGTLDMYTGEYLGDGPGYPRTHNKSLPWEKSKKNNNPKWGVTNWLNKNGISNKQEQMDLLRKYVPEATHQDSKESLCLRVSQNFNAFQLWVKNIKI